MGDGGFRISKPLKDDVPQAAGTANSVVYMGQGQLTPWQHNICNIDTKFTDVNNFESVQKTRNTESTDEKNTLNRAETYHKSYWMLQLYNKDNFILGTNGDDILMAHDLESAA